MAQQRNDGQDDLGAHDAAHAPQVQSGHVGSNGPNGSNGFVGGAGNTSRSDFTSDVHASSPTGASHIGHVVSGTANGGGQFGGGTAAPTAAKSTSLQNYHLLAFRKALHPEFFGIEGRQRVQHGDYETEAWIFRGGHSLRFQLQGFVVSEVVVEHIDQIPDRGLVTALPCAGERDFEERVAENLVYMTTMQTETLSDHLYLGTYKEMMQHARENDSLYTAWTDAAGKPNLSLIDVQHFRNESHVQGFHLRSDCGLVLRTQSMIQIVAPKKQAGKPDAKGGTKSAARGGSKPSSSR